MNRPYAVVISRANLASASYDGSSDALILVTQPIATGAFRGATATLHLGFDYATAFKEICDGHGSAFVAMPFGDTNPSSVDVQ